MKELLDIKLTALVVMIFGTSLLICWSQNEDLKNKLELNNAKLADLSRLKSKDSTLQAKHNDSLRQVIFEAKNPVK